LLLRLATVFVVVIIWARQAALLQLRAGFEGLDATFLALDLGVCAGEEQGDVRSYFVAE
jgi:hypothetical protein